MNCFDVGGRTAPEAATMTKKEGFELGRRDADEEMATTFYSVGLRARKDNDRTVVVDVDAELTNGATGIELQRAASKDYSDGSSLVCELIITEGAGDRFHSDSKPFPHAYSRRYVVLTYRGAIIRVAPIQDG